VFLAGFGLLVFNDDIKKHTEAIEVSNEYMVSSCCGGGATIETTARRYGLAVETLVIAPRAAVASDAQPGENGYSVYLWNTKEESFAPLRWHSKQSLTGSIFNGFPAGSNAWKTQLPVAPAFLLRIMTSVFALGPGE